MNSIHGWRPPVKEVVTLNQVTTAKIEHIDTFYNNDRRGTVLRVRFDKVDEHGRPVLAYWPRMEELKRKCDFYKRHLCKVEDAVGRTFEVRIKEGNEAYVRKPVRETVAA